MSGLRSAKYWRDKLELASHVEGGSFREIYRSSLQLPGQVLKGAYGTDRPAATGIYFLLEYGEFSAFHRLASDETWHFYDGDLLSIYEIDGDGVLLKHLLGRDLELGAALQLVIPAGTWFASVLEGDIQEGYALCGCTVAPGFDFEDFELAQRDMLAEKYPQHSSLIHRLTR